MVTFHILADCLNGGHGTCSNISDVTPEARQRRAKRRLLSKRIPDIVAFISLSVK